MTDKQLSLARHALGLPNKNRTSYRNHFCIGSDAPDHMEWEQMVSQGDAHKTTGKHWGGDDMFFLTLKGALAARMEKEHVSREERADMHRREVILSGVTHD
jgi:hypothetical protein